jgi:Na+-translocating ferredoxin:NAD+ oxidoreductase RnfG subunit
MSETAGIGTKVREDKFLAQFKGKYDTFGVDTVGGATVSSKAVLNGVSEALNQVNALGGQ